MRHKQRGVTLVEMVVSFALMAVVATWIAKQVDQHSSDTKTLVVAQHMNAVGDAVQAYVKDNYSAVMAVATPTQPALITVPMLVTAKYLNTGFSATNGLGQSVCALVLQPTAGALNAMVVAEGGQTIDDLSLGDAVSNMGATGGGIYSDATTTFRGAMGGWSFAIGNFANANNANQHCNGTAGTVALAAGHPVKALWFADGDVTSGFLYRDPVAGRPELNTMNTPILLGATTIQTVGNACATNGALGRDTNGSVVSCVSGVWTKAGGSIYWADPVPNRATLLATTCTAAEGGQTRVVRTPTTGSGARAYTCDGAGNWQALAIDDAGSITIPGTATIGTLDGNLQVNPKATEGTACTGEGRIAQSQTTSGLILSCQSGVWKSPPGRGITLASLSYYYTGTYDLGWHLFCAMTGTTNYGGGAMSNLGGPDAGGKHHWQVSQVGSGEWFQVACFD